jgi:hypothetical protein
MSLRRVNIASGPNGASLAFAAILGRGTRRRKLRAAFECVHAFARLDPVNSETTLNPSIG